MRLSFEFFSLSGNDNGNYLKMKMTLSVQCH